MVFFGKKKEEIKVGKGFVPVQRVKEMVEKGFSEIEIIDTLRKEGFSAEEIDKAFTEVYKDIVARQAPQNTQIQPVHQTQNISLPQIQQMPTQNQNIQQIFQTQQIQPVQQVEVKKEIKEEKLPSYEDIVSLGEYIEAFIRERMEEHNKRLMEITLKFKEIESKISELDSKIGEVEKSRKDEIDRIFGEIRNVKNLINDVIVKVEVLTNTVKELLPSLLESVRLLSEIVQRQK
jgi:DNA-binding transcriptional MerR regulator